MLFEGAELVGESGKTYLAVSPLGQANVWTAVEKGSSNIVVIKEPGEDDRRPGWPSFQHEMVMHELLKDSDSIRQQVDRIRPTKAGEPPMLVLEIFETTLWSARSQRPFTTAELKSVCKDALVGLVDVHTKGLVYADLKMQNIMVDGFDPNSSSENTNLTATLGDLGIVMEPAYGKVQPVAYRAPEVHFKGEITSKADIWGWGLIYCHLLEARNRFSKTGLYDFQDTATGSMAEREQAIKSAISNDYKISKNAYFQDIPLPPKDDRTSQGDQWEELRRRGLEDGEVDFLRWVMRADPRKRPSARQILDCGWLDKSEEETASGFQVPANGVGESSMEFDPTRSPFVTPSQAAAHGEKQETLGHEEIGRKPSTDDSATDAIAAASAPHGQYTDEYDAKAGAPVQPVPAQTTVVNSRPTTGKRAQSAMDDAIDRAFANFSGNKRQVGEDNMAAPSSVESTAVNGAPSTLAAQPPVRPEFSTKNTGTFLSYR